MKQNLRDPGLKSLSAAVTALPDSNLEARGARSHGPVKVRLFD